eukprot:4960680-Pleurochrysis_carterae.AAC.8
MSFVRPHENQNTDDANTTFVDARASVSRNCKTCNTGLPCDEDGGIVFAAPARPLAVLTGKKYQKGDELPSPTSYWHNGAHRFA